MTKNLKIQLRLVAGMLVLAFFTWIAGAPVSAQSGTITATCNGATLTGTPDQVTASLVALGCATVVPTGTYVDTAALNFRSGPGTAYEILGSMPRNTEVVVEAKTADGKWCRLDDNSWMACWLLEGVPDALAVDNTLIRADARATAAPAAAATRGGAAAPSAVSSAALKYDEHGCDAANLAACAPAQAAWASQVGGHEFPAIYLRNVQAGERTPSDAIVNIQQMAAAVGATSWDRWLEFRADTVSPTLLWCAAGFSGWFPPDTDFPLGLAPGGTAQIVIMSSHFSAVPPAGQTAFKCLAGDGWAVLLH